MKTKYILAALTLAALPCHAAVTSLDIISFDSNNDGLPTPATTVSSGIFSVSTAATGTTILTSTYTISGLDLAGDDGADDSFVFTVVATSTGGDINEFQGRYGVGGALNTGETLNFVITAGTITLGGGGTAPTVTNNGYQSFFASGTATDDFAVGTTDFTVTGGATAARVDRFDANFSFIPVPEPSSAALIGLGGLALILRRRK